MKLKIENLFWYHTDIKTRQKSIKKESCKGIFLINIDAKTPFVQCNKILANSALYEKNYTIQPRIYFRNSRMVQYSKIH